VVNDNDNPNTNLNKIHLNCSAKTSSLGPETKHSQYWKWTETNLEEILEVEHMTERKRVKSNNRNASYTLTFRYHFNK
jgi:hypothetical protein